MFSLYRLQRFEKTNEMLINCNALSNGRLKAANDDFKKHIKLINDMKKDLDYVFKKIRSIKSRIGVQYPDAMKRAEQKCKNTSLSEESKEEDISPNEPEPHSSTDPQSDRLSNSKRQERNTIKDAKHSERKLSKECVTVNYVQMETSTENGISDFRNDVGITANDAKTENDSTDNESSDCTSDT